VRNTLLAALACALCVGCSGSSNDNHPDAGKPDAGDPVKVYGLDLNDCYELSNTDASQTPPSLGIAVESDSTASIYYLPDGGSQNVQARTLVYRQTGNPRMTDYLYVDGNNVLLLKRDVANAEQIEYHPAVVVARTPIKSGDHLEQSGQIRVFGGAGTSDPQAFALTLDVSEQTLATPSNAAGSDAFNLLYSGGPSRLASWAFVPGTGVLEADVAFAGDDAGVPVYKLQGARTLSAGQICGTTN
jgi:hypothetical protein